MKSFFRPPGIFLSLLLGCATGAWAQAVGTVSRVDIKFSGPASVSEAFIRDNLKLKAGANYFPGGTQDDVHSLYATGQFYNIRVAVDEAKDGNGVVVTYIVQVRPRITDIKLEGNKELSDSKLKKKISVKTGDALDEQKLFTDVQEMKKVYEKAGYPDTAIKYVLSIDEATGHGAVIYQVKETPKIAIMHVDFPGAAVFSPKKLRAVTKTEQHWMWSWLTDRGTFNQEDFDGDPDRLTEFYRSHGYLDFEVKDVKREFPTTNTMNVKFYVSEGHQYKVGSVKFSGEKIFSDAEIIQGVRAIQAYEGSKARLGTNGLPMDVGSIFTPDGLTTNSTAIEDFYGSKGYIEIAEGRAIHVETVPNIEKGTMDLDFQIGECARSYVQKIDIRGNVKTKDKVIRRELAISPGDVFNMVQVKISKQRLEGLQFFDKVDAHPEATDPPIPGRKNLILNVEEGSTGNMGIGAGYSSVDALTGYVEVSQGNFDLFHPPYFMGGGQKVRVKVTLGTLRQDYELSFTEPWFMNRKLTLGVDLYDHQLDYISPNNIYNENRTGGKVSLTRALGSDFLIGSLSYTAEQVKISLNNGWHDWMTKANPIPTIIPPNVPNAILQQVGTGFYQRVGGSLAYDTRNSNQLPNHGQRTELTTELSAGKQDYYKMELHSAWYFPGFFKGHVLELLGRTGVAQGLSGGDVPFYDRYFLGGLGSLRGFTYNNVAPRQPYNASTPHVVTEPIGGDDYWFSSAEYSIPLFEKEGGVSLRFAMFYDIGAVNTQAFSYSARYSDDWGLGIRLNIPHLGPLRLDYGFPISHDKYNGSSGKFQFGVGYTREF